MKEWLAAITEQSIVLIDVLVLVVILYGTVEAFVRSVHGSIYSFSGHQRRDVWLRYARWLVAGLTFQLAGDIIETSFSSDWQSVGRIAAIAVVRTFLNYFLERDLTEIRERQNQVVKE